MRGVLAPALLVALALKLRQFCDHSILLAQPDSDTTDRSPAAQPLAAQPLAAQPSAAADRLRASTFASAAAAAPPAQPRAVRPSAAPTAMLMTMEADAMTAEEEAEMMAEEEAGREAGVVAEGGVVDLREDGCGLLAVASQDAASAPPASEAASPLAAGAPASSPPAADLALASVAAAVVAAADGEVGAEAAQPAAEPATEPEAAAAAEGLPCSSEEGPGHRTPEPANAHPAGEAPPPHPPSELDAPVANGGGGDGDGGGGDGDVDGCCPVCLEPPDDAVLTRCKHTFCKQCILGWTAAASSGKLGSAECPICRASISLDELMPLPRASSRLAAHGGADGAVGWAPSAKIGALLAELRVLQARSDPRATGEQLPSAAGALDASGALCTAHVGALAGGAAGASRLGCESLADCRPDKAVVFTQFATMLDLLEAALRREHVRYRRLDAASGAAERQAALAGFAREPGFAVLLASLRACAGGGANLTMANHVFFVEPAWTPALEEAALERVHRIGQPRDVHVCRLVVRGSVEERMLDASGRKGAGSGGASGSGPAQLGLGKTQTSRRQHERDLPEVLSILKLDGPATSARSSPERSARTSSELPAPAGSGTPVERSVARPTSPLAAIAAVSRATVSITIPPRARGGGPHACPRRGCVHALGVSEYCTLVRGASDDDEGSDSASPDDEPERRFPCDEPGCEYSATTASTLKRHTRTHSGERPFPCDEPECNFSAAKAGNLTRHKRTHSGERPFVCDEPGCGYSATSASHLTTHKRTHSGERPYACDEPGCELRASQPGSLKKHKRTHSGERPFPCDEPGCEYSATTRGHLTVHKRTHSGERPFSCNEPGCEFRATTPGWLMTHKRTHSVERPFPGDEPGCEYSATTAGSLERHKRTHIGERPFPCDEPGCEYSAARPSHLTAHKRTHSGERPYYCTLVGGASDGDEGSDSASPGDEPERRFPATTASTLKRHTRTHSGERP
ncbi:hypothetical protein T492DRAFT_882663, partial [Pavlovales sp. CCMP2436]